MSWVSDGCCREGGVVRHDDSNNNAIKTKGTSKNFNNKHRYESRRNLSMSVGSARANYTNRNSAGKIAEPYNKSSSKKAKSSILGLLESSDVMERVFNKFSKLTTHNNCKN